MSVRRWFLPQSLACSLALISLATAQNQPSQLPPASPAAPSPAPGAKPPALPPTSDPKEIVRRAIEADENNYKMERNYTYQDRSVIKKMGGHGNAKSQEIRTYDITAYHDELYRRLIQKDDKPLSDKDQTKEDEKLDKFLQKRKNESEEDRRKRLAQEEKEREKERAFDKDVMNAYDFQLLGDEQVDGRDMFVIQAIPRKDFQPTQPHAGMLSKLKGKVWIDKKDYGWSKMEIEAVDTISFGIFLVRLHKGSLIKMEQTKINDEVWLMKHLLLDASARVMLLKNESFNLESEYSNYKKFATSSRILPGVKEVPEEKPAK